jgi:flavodoxin
LVHDLEQLAPDRQIVATMAEKTQPDDLLTGNVLVLACATWNTGGSEGQLNPHMRALQEKAPLLDLGGKPCACIGLGDDRYFYTARAVDLLQDYVTGHNGRLLLPSLRIVNEPYGQEQKVRGWARQLVEASRQTGWS